MTRELVLRIKWTQVSIGSCSLFKRATLSTLDIACLINWSNISSDMDLSKDTQTLCASCCTHDVLSLKSKVHVTSFTLGRESLRLVSLNLSNLHSLPLFVSNGVCRAERVDMSLGHEISLSDIAIIISGEPCRVFALLMSWHSFCPWNIIYLIGFLSLSIVVPVFLGLCALNVRNVHLITNKLRRCDGTGLNLSEVINW